MDPKVEAYVKLFDRQMTHHENTQGIEWKVNIGVWTLLAAAVVWASKNLVAARAIPCWGWTTALLLAVAAHALWLGLVHASEEADKKGWLGYRADAETVLRGREVRPDSGRGKIKATAWLISEAGVTVAMALVLWLLVTTPAPTASKPTPRAPASSATPRGQ